ncbi:putative pentatricopeptide repeat-containing protein At1g10330 [Pyrus communis]|uniref:putative pentatricopeptide repeat-containing protein At1g10330 n=1 Tax=Pyrus communis TaxID=23211 RepID=UPI0035C1F519
MGAMGFLDPNNLMPTTPNKKKKNEMLLYLLAITPSTSLLPLLNLPITVNLPPGSLQIVKPTFLTSFMSFYVELAKLCKTHKVFEEFEPCVVAWNAMIDEFVKNRDMGSAVLLFESMPKRDVVSWTSIINGFERNWCFSEGIRFFQMMMNHENVMGCFMKSNEATYVSVLSSCANLGGCKSIYWGKQIHGHESKSGVIEALTLRPDAGVQYPDDDVTDRG